MSDIVEKFTTHLKNVLTRALVLVAENGADTIAPEHLLWGVASESGSVGAEILRKSGINPEALRELFGVHATVSDEFASATDALPRLSEASKRVIEKAVLTATVYEHRYVGTEHLVAGILQVSSPHIASFVKQNKINLDEIRGQLNLIMKGTKAFPQVAQTPKDEARKTKERDDDTEHERDLDEDFAHTNAPTLEYFATELTTSDALTTIDPVIGRDDEIDRTIEILSRRTKNNPILVGEPGVGKTAIVEGLARRIVEGNVPAALLNKRIFSIDLGSLIAGTVYRGEFEGRMKQMIDEVRDQPDIILFVDEVHMVMGAGSASGSLDAANMLKPALARGWIRCIGATTAAEYKKSIESDGALERRFQMIRVDEPSEEETLQILRGVASCYEEHHHVAIPDDTLRFAVQASVKHIHTNALPDKAIDLIDEAAAMLRVSQVTEAGWRNLVNELRALRDQKRFAVVEERFLDASLHKQQEDVLEDQIKEARAAEREAHYGAVTREMIARVIERKTGARVSAVAADERKALANLSVNLKRAIFGQDEAIDRVSAAVRRAALGIQSTARPLGSFLFVGPSGTGKSELARQLALQVFHSEKSLIRLDMSEFAESHSVSKLIGSPAGYVGYRDTARLTDAVKQRPNTVVLFDEIEKAHADVHHLLLQILEHGQLTDATGRTISFRQAFIVLTSNVGAELFENGAIGFQESDTLDIENIRATLKDRFRTELLNRIDHIQVFQPLDKTSLKRIVQCELSSLKEQLHRQDIDLKWRASVVSHVLGDHATRKANARNVKHQVQTHITDLVADFLINHPSETHLLLTINKNAIDLSSVSR